MLVLILDSKTALLGAKDGIALCLTAVIPSLFPFFVLSVLLTSALMGTRVRLLAPIGALCRIPAGSECILLTGLLGGYPTGAQAVAQSFDEGKLTEADAKRMLGFCSNAGPAFLFGIVGTQFFGPGPAWILWGIHILSALIVGALLPGGTRAAGKVPTGQSLSLTHAVQRSVKILAGVCGWILLFRVVLAFLIRWFLWLLPKSAQVAVMGILELTIGCTELSGISCVGERFVLCAGMLAFGGVCVTMQTASVTGRLGLGMYLPGKLLQCAVSIFLALIAQALLFSKTDRWNVSAVFFLLALLPILAFLLISRKKGVEIPKKVLYNPFKSKRAVTANAVSKKN